VCEIGDRAVAVLEVEVSRNCSARWVEISPMLASIDCAERLYFAMAYA